MKKSGKVLLEPGTVMVLLFANEWPVSIWSWHSDLRESTNLANSFTLSRCSLVCLEQTDQMRIPALLGKGSEVFHSSRTSEVFDLRVCFVTEILCDWLGSVPYAYSATGMASSNKYACL